MVDGRPHDPKCSATSRRFSESAILRVIVPTILRETLHQNKAVEIAAATYSAEYTERQAMVRRFGAKS